MIFLSAWLPRALRGSGSFPQKRRRAQRCGTERDGIGPGLEPTQHGWIGPSPLSLKAQQNDLYFCLSLYCSFSALFTFSLCSRAARIYSYATEKFALTITETNFCLKIRLLLLL